MDIQNIFDHTTIGYDKFINIPVRACVSSLFGSHCLRHVAAAGTRQKRDYDLNRNRGHSFSIAEIRDCG
jgi:hypothetical protein